MSRESCDILIIGGAVIGCASAYFLSQKCSRDTRIVVVERDPSYTFSSTALSAASIRVQFSNAVNVAMSLYGAEFIRGFEGLFPNDTPPIHLAFRENGYLFMAESARQCQVMRRNHAVQKSCGASVKLLEGHSVTDCFDYINPDGISLSSLGYSGEGWFDNMGLLSGLKRLARENGVEFRRDEVTRLQCAKNKIVSARLASGTTLYAGEFINAAGPRAAEVAAMAGIFLPVERRKRTTFVIQTPEAPPDDFPLVVDPRGVYVRPEGGLWICAMPPEPDPPVACDDFEPRYNEFEEHIWPILARRSRLFEATRVKRQWAGHYAYNTLDQNAIVGRHPEIQNFVFANGFSGHGLQQAPAIGRGLSELITSGAYQSLDLSQLGFQRIVEEKPFGELNIV